MRLRKSIRRPQKLEDEIAYGKDSKDSTKPAFPHLLQLQVVPFDHNLPPAAFPSLPFPTENSGNGDDEEIAEPAENAQASSGDDYEMSDIESFPTTAHSKVRSIPSLKSPLDPAFEDEMAASDEDKNTMPEEHENYQPSGARGINHGLLGPQVEIADSVEWKDLRPAVQLAIVSGLSDRCSMTKVFDMLGLYAQDLGDVRRLVACYNYQRELEDYLISSMQQDQRSGILRTDHTLRSRGAPEAYQEFQTRNYMTKIQAEVDEGLLLATQADVDLGKRFLAQRGIQLSMVGWWGSAREYFDAARPQGPPTSTPAQPVQIRSELDSGYASARLSPNKLTTGQEAKAANASKLLVSTRNRRGRKQDGTSKPNDHKVDLGRKPASMKKQQPQQTGSPSSYTSRLSPADDASVASSSSRSRRHVRRSSRYDEAIAELKLRGSGEDRDSDYEGSDENNEEAKEGKPRMPLPRQLTTSDKESGPPMPSPKLLITSNKRIIGVPAPSSISAITTKPDHKTGQSNSNLQGILPPAVSRTHSTTPKRVASPLPLQRVVVRPPKTMPKPKQPNIVAQPSESTVMNKFSHSLLGMAKEGNDFTSSLLSASERDTANTTPWVPIKPKEICQQRPLPTGGSWRRSETITAPPFSPITVRSDSFSNQDFLAPGAVQSSPQTLPTGAIDMKAGETKTKGSLLDTPNLTSSPAPELHQSVDNSRSIVTEAGSPIPSKQQPTAASASVQTIASSSHGNLTSDVRPLTTTPKSASSTSDDIHRKLDPITGQVIFNHPNQQQNHNITTLNSSPTKSHLPQAPSSTLPPSPKPQRTEKPNPLQAAGDQVKKAAFDLKNVATEITKVAAFKAPTSTASKNEIPAPVRAAGNCNGEQQLQQRLAILNEGKQSDDKNSQWSQVTAEDPVATGTQVRKKRKYVKSEKQMLKEAGRREGLRREKEARDARGAGKDGENGNIHEGGR